MPNRPLPYSQWLNVLPLSASTVDYDIDCLMTYIRFTTV